MLRCFAEVVVKLNNLHLLHSPERGGKEWFSLSGYEVKSFVDWMKQSTQDREEKIQVLKDLIHKKEP